MQNEHDIVVHAEHLNKIFYSIRGNWRQKKHPMQAVMDIPFLGRPRGATNRAYLLVPRYLMFTWFEK